MSLTLKSRNGKRFSQLNVRAKFNNSTVSSNVTVTYLEAFKKRIGFRTLIENSLTYRKHHNAIFSATDTIDFMINAAILGYSRFTHMDVLRHDGVFSETMNFKVPSEKVCRDLLLDMPAETANELRQLNKKLLELQAVQEGPREVTLNIDDTVVTVFGHQEGSAIGYNPRYKGRPSYKEKLCIVANTDEVLNVTLESGSSHLNNNFMDFYKSCLDILPKNWYVKRIRVDKAVFDQKNLKEWEDSQVEYVVKVRMNQSVKKIIDYVNQHPAYYPWTEIDRTFSVTEITVPLPAWDRARRFVLIRKKLPREIDGQLTLDADFLFRYEYQAIVTSIDYLSPVEIFNEYNQRCDVENKIDELKDGFAFDQNSQQNRKCNELFLLIKMIACNLHNWFKRSMMPEDVQHHEISTFRRIFYGVPGNLLGKGKYRHISFAPNTFLERIINHIRHRLKAFRLRAAIVA